MIESIPELPLLRDKSIYLACLLSNHDNSFMNSYALIEVPTETLPRFVILPSQERHSKYYATRRYYSFMYAGFVCSIWV